MKEASKFMPGFTIRSCLAALFGIALATFLVQFLEAIEGSDVLFAAQALPWPAVFVVLPLILAGGIAFALTRLRLLTRAELLVTFFAITLATHLLGGGFWTMMIGAIGTIPKTAGYEAYDAWPEKLWPHGPNLMENALDQANRAALPTHGQVTWRETEYERGQSAPVPVLENAEGQDKSWLRVRVPLAPQHAPPGQSLVPGEPYLLTVLLRPEELSAQAYYYCRIYYDDDPYFATEAFTSRAPGEQNFLHQTGFARRGMYGLSVSDAVRDAIFVEIGLSGPGRLAIAHAELTGVGTLDAIYRGRQLITQAKFDEIGETPRTELLIRPDKLCSLQGLRFILAGYVPWKDWWVPFSAWTSFAFLCLTGTFCLVILMRRQWIENERYPLPMTRIPNALLGETPLTGAALPPIWYNRHMWLGFAIALFWCLMRGWNAFNSDVPDMNIKVDLSPYFTDPMWGKMWQGEEVRNVTFMVTALFLSLAMFMELNVLMSLVAGFFLFRCQYWFGEATGLALKKEFPFPQQQQIGAYLAYALLILFFARKQLWQTLQRAIRGREPDEDAVLSARTCIAVLALSVAGMTLWAYWVGIPVRGMLVFFAFVLMVGLVAAKVRAECGTPMAAFTPVNMAQLLPIAGGMAFFGPAGVVFVIFANWIVLRNVFYLLPGMQLDLVEMGRRFRLPPRHVLYTAILGIAGGLLLGGWIFLSLGYAVGGDNYFERWPYMDKALLFNDYNIEIGRANAKLLQPGSAAAETGLGDPAYGYLFAAGVTAVLAILRQTFTGFWFHPMGFIVGSTIMMEFCWGSVLTALVIRAVALRIGGAVVVRNKLLPFFVGVFLASVTAYLLFICMNSYLYFFHPGVLRKSLIF